MALSKGLRKWLAKESLHADFFRVDKSKLTETEQLFVERCHERMRQVHRPSWPDFIVSADDRIFGVEVKSSEDSFRPNQVRTFDLLTDTGLMDVYVWVSSKPDKLTPWKKARKHLHKIESTMEKPLK